MAGRIFVAGATGAVGLPLVRLLVADGYEVSGTTRRPNKAEVLRGLGATPVVVDVFDADALRDAVIAARPEVVIHQLTDLPPALDAALMPDAIPRNIRIRVEGTRNLVAAAKAAGVRRIVAQSIAFAYLPAPKPTAETAPLDPDMAGAARLEAVVFGSGIPAVVLRYGRFYGPGTGFADSTRPASLHVHAAADAARRAVSRGAGAYNIAEDDGEVSVARAIADLGWSPDFRL